MTWPLTLDLHYLLASQIWAAAICDRAGYRDPWPEGRYRESLTSPSETCVVATCESDVLGLIVYEHAAACCRLLRLAVLPTYRRRRIGSALANWLLESAYRADRPLRADVSETALAGQLFLKAHGFRCTRILAAPDGGEPLYHFYCRRQSQTPALRVFCDPEE